jgi:curved DNA-binding protein CbpA
VNDENSGHDFQRGKIAMGTAEPDYYQTLQVDPAAEPEVIQAAYHKLAGKYHPDVNKDPRPQKKMAEINAAYEVIGNADKRAKYDKRRSIVKNSDARRAAEARQMEQHVHTEYIRKLLESLAASQLGQRPSRLFRLEQQLAPLDGKAVIKAQDGQYPGIISSNIFEPNSIANQYGSYGSRYSPTSILNQYSMYGGSYSAYSAFNENAPSPPLVVLNGIATAYLTTNQALQPSINPHILLRYLRGG